MPLLDPKEEAIVAAYVRNGGNQTAAWKETHPKSKATDKTLHEAASKFFAQSKVRTRILELHVEVAEKLSDDAALSIEEHMKKLRELRDDARQRGQLSAAIQAEVKRGELRHFYVRQVENKNVDDFSRMTDEELEARIKEADAIIYGHMTDEQFDARIKELWSLREAPREKALGGGSRTIRVKH
jgi:hypothetical protein